MLFYYVVHRFCLTTSTSIVNISLMMQILFNPHVTHKTDDSQNHTQNIHVHVPVRQNLLNIITYNLHRCIE